MTHKTQSGFCLGADYGERKVVADIAEYGGHCMNVLEDDGHPPWSFTVGLFETWRYPELVILGGSRATAHHALESLAAALDDNHRPDLNQPASYCEFPAHDERIQPWAFGFIARTVFCHSP